MTHVNNLIQFLQDNWVTILLLIGAIIVVLVAIADFRVRWARVTPHKEDDVDAKLFKAKVGVFVQFLKDVFRISKNKKGSVKNYLIAGVAGLLIGAGLVAGLRPAKVKTEIVEKEKLVFVEVSAKQAATKKVTSVKAKADGSSETKIVEQSESSEQSESGLTVDKFSNSVTVEKRHQLGVYYVPSYDVVDKNFNHNGFVSYGILAVVLGFDDKFTFKNAGFGIGLTF